MSSHDRHDHNHNHDHCSHGDHDDHHHDHSHGLLHHHGPNNKKGLTIALIITSGIMLLEFFGGLLTSSLALLSDSAHMLSDVGSLTLSLAAFWFSMKPASPSKTYGLFRFEILAAFINGIALFVIAGFIIKEAYDRFLAPPTVSSGTMMIIAAIGLLANLISALSLMKQGDIHDNINVRSAYLHIIGDALGSIGAIIAGIIMLLFSWYYADPIISVIVAVLILKSAWGVLKHAVHILMEGTPIAVDCSKVEQSLLNIEGVLGVHDLHIWTITSGFDSLSCHLLVEDSINEQLILQQAIHKMGTVYKIEHTTIQIEKSGLQHSKLKV